MDDDGDCAEGEGCGYVCSLLYASWTFTVGSDVYAANHSYACSSIWDFALNLVQEENDWTANCSHTLQTFDFNNDSFVNFREYTVVGGLIGGGALGKYLNLNCSDCIGEDNYNPYIG